MPNTSLGVGAVSLLFVFATFGLVGFVVVAGVVAAVVGLGLGISAWIAGGKRRVAAAGIVLNAVTLLLFAAATVFHFTPVFGAQRLEFLPQQHAAPANDFTSLNFDIMNAAATAGAPTSEIATSSTPKHKVVTVFSPDDPGDARVGISDPSNGAHCETANYLVERLLLSKDEMTLRIYHFSGSNHFMTDVETTSCKPIGTTITLP